MANQKKDTAPGAAPEAAKPEAAKPAFYVFPSPGSTFGADGRRYGWAAFEVVEAPAGALDHVGGHKKHSSRAQAEKAAAQAKKAALAARTKSRR